MKQFLLFFPALLLVSWVTAQSRKDSCCLAKKDLVGVWQLGQKGVGNGVEQNFRFFSDGTFFLDMASNEGEDARGIVSLQGKYRLTKNKLYLTFLARSVVEGGKVVILDGMSYSFSVSSSCSLFGNFRVMQKTLLLQYCGSLYCNCPVIGS